MFPKVTSSPRCPYLVRVAGRGAGLGLWLSVCLCVVCVLNPAPVCSVASYGMLFEERGAAVFDGYSPTACVCLGQAPLASLPRLVDEGSSPTSVIWSYIDFRDQAS